MDLFDHVLGAAGSAAVVTAVGTALLLTLRELLVWLLSVWAMATSMQRKEELAIVFIRLLAPRRGGKVRERLAAAKAQIPKSRKPRAGVEASSASELGAASKSLSSS